MIRTVLATIVIAITVSPSKADRAPVTCEQFIASLIDGGKNYEAPPLTTGKTLVYGDFKDRNITMFPEVYMGLSCRKARLDTFEVMPENGEEMATIHAGVTMGIALHAFGLDWKTALNIRDKMVREVLDGGRSELIVEGATVRLYRGATGVPVFQIEYPD